MLHGLGRLAEAGLHAPTLDGAAIVDGLHEAALASPDEEGAGASLLVGSSGILLVAHRLAPSAATADALADAIAANVEHPSNELLLGAPGTMLAARAMHARTGEERFAELWRASARTLLARQEPDGLWTQDMYGSTAAPHRRRRTASPATCSRSAARPSGSTTPAPSRRGPSPRRARSRSSTATWRTGRRSPRDRGPARRRGCSGATAPPGSSRRSPGSRPATTPTARCWPRAASSSGASGRRRATPASATAPPATASRSWPCSRARATSAGSQRARAFAMHALGQVERFRAADGRGRYTLFTGDLGAALLAAACLTGDARFPGIDDL